MTDAPFVSRLRNSPVGQIYFLQVGTDGAIKIGYSKNNVADRIRAHQKGSPHILRWIGVFDGERSDERLAHLLLKNSCMRGEWFYPTIEVLAFVAQKSPDFEPRIAESPRCVGPLVRSAESRALMSKSQQERRARARGASA